MLKETRLPSPIVFRVLLVSEYGTRNNLVWHDFWFCSTIFLVYLKKYDKNLKVFVIISLKVIANSRLSLTLYKNKQAKDQMQLCLKL